MKKFLLVGATILAGIIWTFPALAATYSDGTLIRASKNGTIYYVENNLRRPFVNTSVFNTWFTNYKNVRTISLSDLQSVALGKPMLVKPHTRLVKFGLNPTVYAVNDEDILSPISNGQTAISLFGKNWTKNIIQLPEVYSLFYDKGESLTVSNIPATSVTNNSLNTPTSDISTPIQSPAPVSSDTNNSANSLSTPVISSPYVGQKITDINRKLIPVWTTVSGATQYNVELQHNYCYKQATECWQNYLTDKVAANNQSSTQSDNNLFLGSDDNFRIHVQAVGSNGQTSDWSNFVQFSVDTSVVVVPAPTITLPLPQQIFTSTDYIVKVSWGWVQGATNYEIFVAQNTGAPSLETDPSGWTQILDYTTTDTLIFSHNVLIPTDGSYRVKIRANSMTGGAGPWSDYVYFSFDTSGQSTATPIVTKPTITSPSVNATVTTNPLTISWTKVDGAINYNVNISCSSCSANNPWWYNTTVTATTLNLPISTFVAGLQTYDLMVTPINSDRHDGTASDHVSFNLQK